MMVVSGGIDSHMGVIKARRDRISGGMLADILGVLGQRRDGEEICHHIDGLADEVYFLRMVHIHGGEEGEILEVIMAEEVEGMEEEGQGSVGQAAEAKGHAEILSGDDGGKATEVQEIAYMDRHFEDRHGGDGDFDKLTGRQEPTVRFERAEAIAQGTEQELALRFFGVSPLVAAVHEIVSSG